MLFTCATKLTAIFSLPYSILPLNEGALLVSFGNSIDETIHEAIVALQQSIQDHPFIGFVESVPAYCSLAIFYDVEEVRRNNIVASTVFDFVRDLTTQILLQPHQAANQHKKQQIEIPVLYNGEDLAGLAAFHQLPVAEIIRLHTANAVKVFMIGFLPGFAYMGKVDDRIATARLAVPRATVKAGSVGIAGSQTGIYPMDSPGGWQIIGQSPLKIFDINKTSPCLLQAGDSVKFIAIDQETFDKLNEY